MDEPRGDEEGHEPKRSDWWVVLDVSADTVGCVYLDVGHVR